MVRPVTPDDWHLLRDARLTALVDVPSAFGSTYAEESGFDEAKWRSRASGFVWFIAMDDDSPVGVVGATRLDRPSSRMLFAMWTHEGFRGTGLAETLVNAVCRWARDDGGEELILWNADGNERARRFYERQGFALTGRRKQLRSNALVGETELRLALHARGGPDPSDPPTPISP